MKRNAVVRVPIAVLLGFVGLLSLAGCLDHEKAYEVVDQGRAGTTSEGYGLPPGTAAPDASVLDLQGRLVTLSSVRAHRPAALVFYRGGWCPPCNYQIHELQTHVNEFKTRGLSSIAISYGKRPSPSQILAAADRLGITAPRAAAAEGQP